MVLSVSKRKSRSSKKEDHGIFFCTNLFSTFFRSILYLALITILFFVLTYLWLSFTTLISDNVLYICVFSRKLNDPYCLTAGSKPGFQVPINLTTKGDVLSKDEESGSEKNDRFSGAIPGDTNKILGSQDESLSNDKDGEMGSGKSSNFAEETAGDRISEHDVLDQENKPKNLDSVLDQENKPKNLDSVLGNKDGEMGFPKNVTLAGETAGPKVSYDPSKILPGEEINEYGLLEQEREPNDLDSVFDQEHKPKNLDSLLNNKDGEMGSQNNDALAGVTDGNRVPNDPPTKIFESEDKKEYNALVPEDKLKNLDSVLDQEPKPTNKVDIDLKADEEYDKYIKPKSEGQGYALRAVIKYLYLQISWLSLGNDSINKPRSCEGKGVYVYDLPSKFNKDVLVECNDILPRVNLCSYFKNEGFGEAIENLGQGWYGTHMYSLEPILHSRFLKHPCRVYNETQAKLFYVLYYGGFDVLRWHYRNVSDDVKDRLGIKVLKWLESKESWRRHAGKDHVFVLGKVCNDSGPTHLNKFKWTDLASYVIKVYLSFRSQVPREFYS